MGEIIPNEGSKKWHFQQVPKKNTAKKAHLCFTDLDGSLLRDVKCIDKKNKE